MANAQVADSARADAHLRRACVLDVVSEFAIATTAVAHRTIASGVLRKREKRRRTPQTQSDRSTAPTLQCVALYTRTTEPEELPIKQSNGTMSTVKRSTVIA